jgi:hypothetical protein
LKSLRKLKFARSGFSIHSNRERRVVVQINALRVPLGTRRHGFCGVPTSPRNERGEAKTGLRKAIG